MKKIIITLLISSIIFSFCSKEKLSDIKPVIKLSNENNFISKDTSLPAGNQYQLSILASAENGENLTNLIIKSNSTRVFDNGYNTPTLFEDIILTKNNDESERITIIIRNKARLSDSISIVITKLEQQYSEIIKYNSVELGCHENTTIGNYYSLINSTVYTQAEAFNNQPFIDIIYFYDAAGDENALGSPGANLSAVLSGSDAPENWSVNRTTRYSRTPIALSDNEFNTVQNDSLILEHLFTDGGRKAKNLTNGEFYGFVTEEGKYGIIKIKDITGQAEGTIQFSLIMQE